MSEREQLIEAIARLDEQRAVLGDAAVDAAISGLRTKLAAMEAIGRAPAKERVKPELGGERRIVTVMFADVSGFTALSEKMDPETVREIMNGCFEILVPIIDKFEGTVDKFIGDEIMALFGAPTTHENDPERALFTALEMTAALDKFNRERHVGLGLHFGINTGPVIAGGIGAGSKEGYSVMGDAVNVAKRLEENSKRGEILVGHDTYRLTADSFVFATPAPIKVKGRREAVLAHRLMDRAQPSREVHISRQSVRSPMVGRVAELSELQACMQRLSKGSGGIVSIIGEAGMGKSRLLEEMRDLALDAVADNRLQWLEGHNLSIGREMSYWVFQVILRQYCGIAEEDTEAAARQKLRTRMESLFRDEVDDILPYLARLISIESETEQEQRTKYLDAEAMRGQLYRAMRRFVEKLAERCPLALVFEDLHWADESSVALLEHLMPMTRRHAFLICGVSRPDPGSPAAHLRHIASNTYRDVYVEIVLEPLGRGQNNALIASLLDVDQILPALAGPILAKSEGNPYFTEEIVRSLIERGQITRSSGSEEWQIAEGIDRLSIPDTIQAVIMARIDRLDGEVRQALRIASVIGRSFLYRILRGVWTADVSLDHHLSLLESLEMIQEKRRIPELEYMFSHALSQEATYESILLQKRRELHAKVAQVIEATFAERLEEFCSLLAYHYARAEEWEKARDYLFRAGDQAGGVAADSEALAYYRHALELYERTLGSLWDQVERASLERKIAEAFFRRSQTDKAMEYLERAFEYLGSPLPKGKWKVRTAIIREVGTQALRRIIGPRLRNMEDGEPGLRVEEQVRANEITAWIEAFGDTERFLLCSLRALNISEREGYARGVARGCTGIGITMDLLPAFRIAERYHNWALGVAEQIDHKPVIGLAYLGKAFHGNCLAQWEKALDQCGKAAAAFEDMGDFHAWGCVGYFAVAALVNLARYHEALELSRRILKTGEDGADHQVSCWGNWATGHVLLHTGDVDAAISSLREAKKLSEITEDMSFYVVSCIELGIGYLKLGDREQALEEMDRGMEFYNAHPQRAMGWLPFRNPMVAVYMAMAEHGPTSQRDEWMSKAASECRLALKHAGRYRGVLPEAMRLKGTYEWLNGRHRRANRWWKRSLDLARELGQAYDVGMSLVEMGSRREQQDLLDSGLDILAQISRGRRGDDARSSPPQ